MARTKGSQNKSTTIKNTIKSKAQLNKEKYKYSLGEYVIYIGKLYDDYINQEAIVISRSTSNGKQYYKVKFTKNNKELMLYEQLLKPKFEQITMEDVINEQI